MAMPHRAPSIEDYGIPSFRCIVVTGPRELGEMRARFRRDLRWALLQERDAGDFTLVHGKAKGVDLLSQEVADELGIEWIPVPYFGWLRGGGGPARNGFMLREYDATSVHAFHFKSYESLPIPGSGTADCFRQALAMGIYGYWHNVSECVIKHYPPAEVLI